MQRVASVILVLVLCPVIGPGCRPAVESPRFTPASPATTTTTTTPSDPASPRTATDRDAPGRNIQMH